MTRGVSPPYLRLLPNIPIARCLAATVLSVSDSSLWTHIQNQNGKIGQTCGSGEA
jgi:hypothetical protein